MMSGSKGVEHCTKTDENLRYDADWLTHMAMAQLITLPFFFVWRQFAVFSKDPSKGPSESEKKRFVFCHDYCTNSYLDPVDRRCPDEDNADSAAFT